MSVEALAMAGVDYNMCYINLEEMDGGDSDKAPQYLLAEEKPKDESEMNEKNELMVEKPPQVKENLKA
ncbi:hypothetical protein ACE6H2_020810 [Prunus campanulata]